MVIVDSMAEMAGHTIFVERDAGIPTQRDEDAMNGRIRRHLPRSRQHLSPVEQHFGRDCYPAPAMMCRVTAAKSSLGEKSTYSVSSIADGE